MATRSDKTVRLAKHLILLAVGALWVAPLFWMISTSFKSEKEIFTFPLHWIPWEATLENFRTTFEKTHLLLWLKNSFVIMLAEVVVGWTIWAMTAYAFAKIRFKGRNVLFLIVLSTMMIPGQVTLIPTYLMLNLFGLINTVTGVVLPQLSAAVGIFLLKQFFEGIPNELSEAARIDGCGHFRIFWTIVLPLAKPAVFALMIFISLRSWNDYLWPLIVLQDTDKMTLPVGLASLQGTYGVTSYGVLMASSLLASLPILIILILFQDRIIKGVALSSGIKT
jgi:ABC-type glycerol-3-phosphate transport system permease component